MIPIRKVQVYLFDDCPLEVVVIDGKGKVVGKGWYRWEEKYLRLDRIDPLEPEKEEQEIT